MAGTDEILTTDVDSLLKFVEEKKEISIEGAAKELNVPEVTIEAWSNFLEEEGVLEIKFKFTKPYLVYKGKKEEESKKAKQDARPVPLAAEIAEAEIENTEETEEIPYDDIPEVLLKRGFGKEKVKKEEKKPELKKTELKDSNAIKLGAAIPEPAIPPEQQAKAIENINEALIKVHEEMKLGRFDYAKQLYGKIKEEYDRLPETYEEKKDQLMDQLIDLSKKLAISIDMFNEKEMNISTKRILDLSSEVQKSVKRRDFKSAEEQFKQIKEIYKQLPRGFIERKAVIHDNILQLHEYWLNQKTSYLLQELKAKTNQINLLLEQAGKAIEKEDVDNADRLYQEMIKIKDSLPEGFLQRKIEVTEKILNFHEELIEIKADISIEEVKVKHKLTDSYIKRSNNHLKENDIDGAVGFYKQAKKIFNSIPRGFLEEKNILQKDLDSLDKTLLSLKMKSSMLDFRAKAKRILNLLNLSMRYINKSESDLAATVYDEILNIYNTLPDGYLEEKTKLKTKMLDVYEKSVLASDILFLKQVDEKVKQRYEELLAILINSHKHIELGQFNAIYKDYEHARKLYEELPYGFIKRKLKIIDEIKKLGNEVKLMQYVKEIKEMSTSDYRKIKKVLDKIYDLYDQLNKESPEDKNLLDYVKGACAPFSLMVIEKGKSKGSKGKDIKEEAIISRKNEEQLKKEKEEEIKRRKAEREEKANRMKQLRQEKSELIKHVLEDREKAKEAENRSLEDSYEIIEEQNRIKKKKEELAELRRKHEQEAQTRLVARRIRIEDEKRKDNERLLGARRIKEEEEKRKKEDERKRKEEEHKRRLQEQKEKERLKRLERDEKLILMKYRKKYLKRPFFKFMKKDKKVKTELDSLLRSKAIGVKPKDIKREQEIEEKPAIQSSPSTPISQKIEPKTNIKEATPIQSTQSTIAGKAIAKEIVEITKPEEEKKKPARKTALERKQADIEEKLRLLDQGIIITPAKEVRRKTSPKKTSKKKSVKHGRKR